MSDLRDEAVINLELVAAITKALARDLRNNNTWEREAGKRLGEASEALKKASRAIDRGRL